MFNDPPRRKRLRLASKDYSEGAYFVTICTIGSHLILGKIDTDEFIPTVIGEIVRVEWMKLPDWAGVALDEFVVMPNHMHGIIVLERTNGLTLPIVMQQFKSRAVKALQSRYCDPECRIWQRGYHDKIISGSRQLAAIRAYIRNNPRNWETDEYWKSDRPGD